MMTSNARDLRAASVLSRNIFVHALYIMAIDVGIDGCSIHKNHWQETECNAFLTETEYNEQKIMSAYNKADMDIKLNIAICTYGFLHPRYSVPSEQYALEGNENISLLKDLLANTASPQIKATISYIIELRRKSHEDIR